MTRALAPYPVPAATSVALPIALTTLLRDDLAPRMAALRSTTVVMPDLPFVATASRETLGSSSKARTLLVCEALTFEVVRRTLENRTIAGVVVASNRFADHARKMLQEGGKALVVCHESIDLVPEGGRFQVDRDGLVDLDHLPVPVTAICSYLTDENEALYKAWNVRDVGYFRLKFCLFQLLTEEPEAYLSERRIESYLTGTLCDLVDRGWDSVRLVLSDPTSAELRELDIEVAAEENPELGVRGPRAAERWQPEVNAIRNVLRYSPDTRIQVSVPFVSSVEEFVRAAAMFAEAGLGEAVGLGFTLEVPAMLYALPALIAEHRPAFVAVGTSDLFALINGVDRNHAQLTVDPFSAVNRQIVEEICTVAASHGVHFFVCGEIRRNPGILDALIRSGCGELIATASVVEIARMNRASAGPAPVR